MLGHDGAAPGQHATVSAKKVSAWLMIFVTHSAATPDNRVPTLFALNYDQWFGNDSERTGWCWIGPTPYRLKKS